MDEKHEDEADFFENGIVNGSGATVNSGTGVNRKQNASVELKSVFLEGRIVDHQHHQR